MDPLSRHLLLAAGAGGLAATQAAAQPSGPEPVRGEDGATILGPRNNALAAQNPDLLTPPPTDHGDLPNLKWSFADSHMRLEDGAFARQPPYLSYPFPRQLLASTCG